MKTTKRIVPALLVLASMGCAPDEAAPDTTEADRAAIVEQAGAFSAAYMAGDVEAMVSLYTADGVLLPGNSEYIRGSDAIRDYWDLPAGRTITHHRLTPVEIAFSGDMASDFGYYEVAGVTNGESWGPSHGKYVVVWKKGVDGVWRLYLDMWNSRPAPAG